MICKPLPIKPGIDWRQRSGQFSETVYILQRGNGITFAGRNAGITLQTRHYGLWFWNLLKREARVCAVILDIFRVPNCDHAHPLIDGA